MQLCFAPMDGITTCATRLLTKEIFETYGHPNDKLMLRTEFMNVDGFLINPENVVQHLQTTLDQQPIAQIYGGNENILIEAATKIEHSYGDLFSGIELNTGCPSNTVMKCGGGSELMKHRKKTLILLQHLAERLECLPFSIKARAGLNEADKKEQADFLLAASKYCSKISIHGRTLKQLYSGNADWEFIQHLQQKIKISQPHCQIIGNGGIISYEQAKTFNEQYHVDGIMIGQAAIGNPRIFTPHHPTLQEKLATLLRHLDLSVACDQLFNACQEKRKGKRMKNSEITNENYRKNICFQKEELQQQIQTNLKQPNFETHSIIEFRKFLFQYVKGIPESREWKNHILTIKSYGGLRNAITTFFETKQTITIEH